MDCILIQSLLRLCCSTFFQFSSPDSWVFPCKRLRSQLIYWTLFTVQFSIRHYQKKKMVAMCLQLFSDNCRFALYSVSLKFEPKKASSWAEAFCISTWKTEKDLLSKSFASQQTKQETQHKTFKSDLRCRMILPEMNICFADAQKEIKIKV